MPLDRNIDELDDGEILEFKIDDYGFTGEGYVRLLDGWLSVRGVIPGERVRARVQPQGNFPSRRRWATLVEVLAPHTERCDPRCHLDDICRGCQLRHMSVREESAYKERAISEVLERYANFPPEEHPPITLIAPQPWARGDAHRIRTALSYRSQAPGEYALGLVASPTDALIPMSECNALIRPVRRLIESVEGALDALAADLALPPDKTEESAARSPDHAAIEAIRIAAPAHGRGFIEITVKEGSLERVEALESLLAPELPEQVSFFINTPGGALHRSGPETLRLPLSELIIEATPQDWFHATLTPAQVLYEHVIAALAPAPGMRILDLGCGVGTISLLAARAGASAVGVDQSISSIAMAEFNALTNGLDEATFQAGSWEAGLRRLAMQGETFHAATINPMREPLGERALAYLNVLELERIMYLGPSPVSAARDLGVLRQMGWEIDALAGAMLHPATYHVMLVASLRRA